MIINSNKERVSKLKISQKKTIDELNQLKLQMNEMKIRKPKTQEIGV